MGDRTQSLSLRNLPDSLHPRRWIILSSMLVAMAAAAVGNYFQGPMYQSCAQIQIDPPRSLPNPGADPVAQRHYYSNVSQHFKTEREKLGSAELRMLFARRLREKDGPFRSVESIARELERKLRVETVAGTNLVALCFSAADPRKAADWLNGYVELAVEESALRQEATIRPSREALRAQLSEIKDLMAAQQKQIKSYLSASDRAGAAAEGESLAELKRAYEDAVKNRTEEQQKLSLLEQCLLPNADFSRLPNLDFAPSARAYAEIVAETNQFLGNIWLEGGDEEQLRALAVEMDLPHFQDQLRAELRKSAEGLRTNLSALKTEEQNALNGYTRELLAERTGSDRLREVSTLQETFASLSKTAAALQDKLDGLALPKMTSVWMAGRAAPDYNPVAKRGLFSVLLSGVAGFVLSAGAVIILEGYRKRRKTVEEIQDTLEVPNLSLLPGPGDSNVNEIRKSYGSLRMLLRRNSQYRTLMITSSLPKEGKTTVAINLARTLAASGDRTVLLDFDLRRMRNDSKIAGPESRRRDRIFSPVNGLNMRLETTDRPGLHVIVPAEAPQCLPFILSQPEIEKLIQYLRRHYDWVLIDTPPMTSAKDPVIIASLVDAVLFVIKDDFVGKKIVKNSMATLNTTNAKILGAVINDFGFRRASRSSCPNRDAVGSGAPGAPEMGRKLIRDAYLHSRLSNNAVRFPILSGLAYSDISQRTEPRASERAKFVR